MTWFKANKDFFVLAIYVVPRSSKSEIVGLYNDCLKIKISAQPHDNEANEELVRFLSGRLKLPKSNIKIIKGLMQKKKTVSISGCSKELLDKLLVR